MIAVLSKSAEQISQQDIQALIDLKVPEGERIEYKQKLSMKRNGNHDDWMSGGNSIGERAKGKILREVVAFANASGGALLLGIRESKTKPPVADKISSIPRCTELAERLKLVFRDCVEPHLDRLEIFAVPFDGNRGVIVLRVGGLSRLAPHRITKTRCCPVRRQDRCEEMTMREIQEMTLNVSRGIERLDRQFSDRAQRYEQEFRFLDTPEEAFGVRVTGMPIGDYVRFDRIYHSGKVVDALAEPWRKAFVNTKDGKPRELEVFPHIRTEETWRPMLRAARADSQYFFAERGHFKNLSPPDHNNYREINCDGLVELGFVASRSFPPSGSTYATPTSNPQASYENSFEPDVPIALLANLIVQAVRVREQAGAPTAEYALEVQILAKGITIAVGRPKSRYEYPLGMLAPGAVTFPRYPLGDSDEALDLLNLFRRDLYNALGADIDEDTIAIADWPNH